MNEVERLRYVILAAQREGNRRLIAALRPLQLTPAQAEVLGILADHVPLSLTGLGAMLVCESGTNPSRLVDRLVNAGLVARSYGSTDRREISLTLTEDGRRSERQVNVIETEVFSPLGSAIGHADLATVVEVLERITAGTESGNALLRRLSADAARVGP
jgi:DNA-binding MarR family transcriptional regulator